MKPFLDLILGIAGHSQGVVSAMVISASNSFASFEENFVKGIKLLAAIGRRAQEAVPVVALDCAMVKDCVNNEGFPSSMLSINGTDLSLLQKHIDSTNKHISDTPLSVSLFNGPTNFVVTGLPKCLYGLILSLRKVKASASEDQSKIPFSKRKPVFSMRFLPIAVPFHSKYLQDCTEFVMQDLENQELWTASELALPVLHTETGEDIRGLPSLTRSLCDQIFCKPIHWGKVTSFAPEITHVVDFGPGGLSGIGPLTARNLDGTGVVAITMNDDELYDTHSFKSADKWSIFSPKLVKTSYVSL